MPLRGRCSEGPSGHAFVLLGRASLQVRTARIGGSQEIQLQQECCC